MYFDKSKQFVCVCVRAHVSMQVLKCLPKRNQKPQTMLGMLYRRDSLALGQRKGQWKGSSLGLIIAHEDYPRECVRLGRSKRSRDLETNEQAIMCYGLNCLLTKITCCSLNPQCGSIWRWALWEVFILR